MAIIKNITDDTLSLFRADAPPIFPGDEVPIDDATFVGRAWPSSTWEVVEPPAVEGYASLPTVDAVVFVPADDVAEPVEAEASDATPEGDETPAPDEEN